MLGKETLGRYENVGGGSNKYWHVVYNKTTQCYVAQWGRIEKRQPQGQKEYSEKEVIKKVREKLKKGYSSVKGNCYVGNSSIHFITSDDDDA